MNRNEANIPAIVVVAYNRPASLQRLLSSLKSAQYPALKVPLVISIDHSKSEKVKSIARDFSWPFGIKRVIEHPERLGLKKHILSCGDLTAEVGDVIILEDDLTVSPWFYAYVLSVEGFFRKDEWIAGIGLYGYALAESSYQPFPLLQNSSDVYAIQFPCSWGEFFTRHQWTQFREWLVKKSEVSVAKIPKYVTQWSRHSWKRKFLEYLIETNRYFIYPTVSLTSNHAETGTNFPVTTKLFEVELESEKKEYNLVDFEELTKYDAWFEPTLESMLTWYPQLEEYQPEIDIYGTKNLNNFQGYFCLSSKPLQKKGGRVIKVLKINDSDVDLVLSSTKSFVNKMFKPDILGKIIKNSQKSISPIKKYLWILRSIISKGF